MSLITTYRHDYIDPRQMVLNYNLKSENQNVIENDCECKPDKDGVCAALAKMLNEKCGAETATEGKSEWTGIAPMGLLIKARVIPKKDGDFEEDLDQCFVDKPNRYLQNLPNSNPTLYEDLRKMNKDDLAKVLNTDRLKTTYQVDYCGEKEFSSGAYGESEMTEDMIRSGLQNGGPSDPCTEQNLFKDHRAPPKRKFEQVYRAKVCCKHCPAVRGHWETEDKLKTSEYNAGFGEIGGLIMNQRLNDHTDCNPNFCKHRMKFTVFKDKTMK